MTPHPTPPVIKSPGLRPRAFCCIPEYAAGHANSPGYDGIRCPGGMGLLYELVVETTDSTTTVQIEANSKEEALEAG